MVEKFYQPERVFQLWSYTIGMGRLLLRSVKTTSFASRIDLLFQNVQALKLPTVLHGLAITKACADDIEDISTQTGLLPDADRNFYVLSGPHYYGYVVAGVVATCEDSREYFEPSEVWPAHRELGSPN